MDLPKDKLHLIRLICETNNASVLQNIKNILEDSNTARVAKEPAVAIPPRSTMPPKSLHQRALAANSAIEEGRLTDLDELEEQIQNW